MLSVLLVPVAVCLDDCFENRNCPHGWNTRFRGHAKRKGKAKVTARALPCGPLSRSLIFNMQRNQRLRIWKRNSVQDP